MADVERSMSTQSDSDADEEYQYPSRRNRTSIWMKDEVRHGVFENAKAAVAAELGHEPNHNEVVREVCRAYTGVDQ